jgi:hypothetical protein
VVPEEVLRRHRHVRLELADPDPVRPLQLEQAARTTVDRLVQARQLCGGSHRQAVTLAEVLLKMC